jgi:hypothetical protein
MSQGRSVPEQGQSGRKGPQKEQVSDLRRHLGAVCLQFGIMKVTDFAEKGVIPHYASITPLSTWNDYGARTEAPQ